MWIVDIARRKYSYIEHKIKGTKFRDTGLSDVKSDKTYNYIVSDKHRDI